MTFLSKLLNLHEETKRETVYIYTMIRFWYRNRRCDPTQPVFVYDSG